MKQIDKDYIDFGDFARGELGMQCQYASYFVDGIAGHPKLCEGLRVKQGIRGLYHTYTIHKDDAKILKKRVQEWRKDPIRIAKMYPGDD